jgi:hypothetical protein
MKYEILGGVWYTPPIVDIVTDAKVGGAPLCVGVVAIKTHGGWKCYLGFGGKDVPEELDAQFIAGNGVKVSKEVACAHFPNLKPEEFIF